MSLLDRVNARLAERQWPVGKAQVEEWERVHGHDDETYSPEEYGDYIVTSNEVFSVVSLRARLAASVQLRLYRGRTEDKQELPESAPAMLLDYVNPFWTPARLARMDETCMGLWGESYWAVEKGPLGEPREIWWLKPSRVKPVPHPDGYLAGYLYESNVNGQVIPFKPDEIVWQRYPNPLDEFSALSPMAAARLAADTASAAMKSNQKMHKQGLQIAGVVMPKPSGTGRTAAQFSKQQSDDLADALERRFSGADKAHKWAVLRYEAQFSPVNMTPKDAEFIDGLGLTLEQICNAYGVPVTLMNRLEHATLANLREFQKALWEHALKPDMEMRAQDIKSQFLPMFGKSKAKTAPDHMEYDFSGVAALQESASETWDRDRQAIEVGALTINEWRKKRGLPSVPWGDVYWAPVNKGPVTGAEGIAVPGGDDKTTERELAEMIQKIYLGVDTVVTWDEAREILRKAGADLSQLPQPGAEPKAPLALEAPPEVPKAPPADPDERIMREFIAELDSFRMNGSKS